MKNIINLLKESKVASIILLTAVIFIAGSVTFVTLNSNDNTYQAEGAAKTYNEKGEILFPAGTKYKKNWDGTANVDGNKVVSGAPLIYDDKSFVNTEEGVVVFPDTSDVYVFNVFTQVTNSNGSYAIAEEGGTNVQSPEMLIKTKSDYYIFLSNNIEVVSNGKKIQEDKDFLVTKQNPDGSVTIFGQENKTLLSSDLQIKTSKGMFNYGNLMYDAEVDTNLARITVGSNDVNKLAFKNNLNKPGNASDQAKKDEQSNKEGSTDAANNAAAGNGSANGNGTGADNGTKNNGATAAGSGGKGTDAGGITGLLDLFKEAENQKNITPPRIITSIMPGFSTVGVKAEIFDPSASITSKVEFYLYDESGKLVAYKESDVKNNVDVNFDSLQSDAKYRLDVKASYKTSKGDEFKGTFSSENFRTSKFNLNISVPKQTSNSLSVNIKTPKEQNITYAKITVNEKSFGGDTLIGEYELDVDQATSPEGQTLLLDSLKSNAQYNISVEDVTISGAPYAVEQIVITHTLKAPPVIQAPIAQVDAFASAFRVISPNIVDADNSISSLQYQVYEVMPDGSNKYVTSIEKEANSINEYANIYIDGSVLKRNTTYKFKTVVKGFDNLNKFEVESEFSGVFNMPGVEPPVATFDADPSLDIDFNKITVDVDLIDKGSTISGTPKVVIYKGSDKLAMEHALTVGKNNDLLFDGLTSNTTYRVEVVGDVNLQDGSGVKKDHVIGTTFFTTKVIGTFDVTFMMDPTCPLIDPTIPDVYDSCISKDGAVAKMNFKGETIQSIKTMTLRILDSSNNVVVAKNLDPTEITELKHSSTYRLKVADGTLKSNQKYKVELFQVTDSANNLPFVMNNTNEFRTKKAVPTVVSIKSTYNEDTAKINTKVDQFKDVDAGFKSLKYELYNVNSTGDLDKLFKQENAANPTNLNVAFAVDGSLIPRGDRYAVKSTVVFNNNYFDEDVVLDTSTPIKVDFLRPKTKIENIVITDKRFEADVTIEDLDNSVGKIDSSKIVRINLMDDKANAINTVNAVANATTKVVFDGLNPGSHYGLMSTVDVMTIDGKINYNLLDMKFDSKVLATELPTIQVNNLNLDAPGGKYNYNYSIEDKHLLVTSAILKFKDATTKNNIFSAPLATSGTNITGEQTVKIPEIKKNLDYEIKGQIEYVEKTIESFNKVDYFQMNENNKAFGISNGAVRSMTKPDINSKVKFFEVAGYPGSYYIQIGDDVNAYVDINGADQLTLGNSSRRARFELINKSGKYILKNIDKNFYVTYDSASGGYKIDSDISKAINFSFYKVKKVDSNITASKLPAAPAPVWTTSVEDIDTDFANFTGQVTDSYNLIKPGTLFFEVWDLKGNRLFRKEFNPAVENTFNVGNLKPLTMYKIQVKGTVDKQELNSKPVDESIIYEKEFETDPIPPPFTRVSANFDIPNRNIIIEDDLVDVSGVYDALEIKFYEGTNLVHTYTRSYHYTPGANTNVIPFQSTPLEVNKTYKVDMQFKSNKFSNSKVVTTQLSTSYPQPTASLTNVDLTDTQATFDSLFKDDNKLIIKDTALILTDTTNKGIAPQRKNVLKDGNTRTTFTGLAANSSYKVTLVATIDIDGKGTESEVTIKTLNLNTLEPMPVVGMMFSEYDRATSQLNVLTMQVAEARKIKTMDLQIYDTANKLIHEEKAKPFGEDVNFAVPGTTLPPNQFVKIIITYNCVLDFNNTKTTIASEQTISTGRVKVVTSGSFNGFEDSSTIKLEQPSKVTYYKENLKVKSEKVDEIKFDDSFSRVVVSDNGTDIPIENPKYVQKVEEPKAEVGVKLVNDSYVVSAQEGSKVTVENVNANFISKLTGLNKKVYTSEQLKDLTIEKDKINNYKFYEEGGVNEETK